MKTHKDQATEALETFTALKAQVEGIAKIWGDGWRATVAEYEHMRDREMMLVRDTPQGQQRLTFIFWWNDFTKVSVRAHCHGTNGKSDEYIYSSDNLSFSINISPTKDAKLAASDIKRRLMPDYEKAWTLSAERLATSQRYKNARQTAVEAVAAALKSTSITPKEEPHIVNISMGGNSMKIYGDFDVSDKTCTIQLRNVPLNFALVIARLVGAQVEP